MTPITKYPAKIVNYAIFRIKRFLRKDPDKFLKKSSGVIHVGANTGQEMETYVKRRLPVIWIEPIPEVFEILEKNIRGVSKQKAIQRLVTDKDNQEYQFHVANNFGAASSIFDLSLCKDIWPEIEYNKTISITSSTLTSIVKEFDIDLSQYDTLIMDTQGSELLVLKGAKDIIKNFLFIKTEVAEFESYKGCCQVKDIESFLTEFGFIEFSRNKFTDHPNGGGYYDIVYKRN